jgi:hypothetical protein
LADVTNERESPYGLSEFNIRAKFSDNASILLYFIVVHQPGSI